MMEQNQMTGLTTAEAERLLGQYGPNKVLDVNRQPLWLQFLLRFRSPLVLLLLAASVLSALTGDEASFFIIVAILLLSVTLDFVQEVQAENTVDALRGTVAVRANVLRDGIQTALPVQDLVPGDTVYLSPGTLVPADGRLTEGKDLYVNQSLLTGESFPVEKLVGPGDSGTAFMGTSIISGTGEMVVTATGKKSRLGGLAGTLARRRPLNAFERGVETFGMLILKLTMGLVLFVLLVNIGFHKPLLESFLFALALAVGLTPELLPMLTTVSLSRGAVRMAKARVIVKHLPAMYNLGAMDVLCTDKTGTLTEADIRLTGAVDIAGQDSESVFMLAYLNSLFESGIKSPLDQAIENHAQPHIDGWTKIDEVPFDFERRRVSVLAEHGNKRFLIVKGAPEDILKLSSQYQKADAVHPMDEEARADALRLFDTLGEQGLRVLAVACREEEVTRASAAITDETELVFSGFVTFMDPPKASAGQAVRALLDAGIAVKILTGDNEQVTRHVCAMLGYDTGSILTGEALSALSDEALSARIDETNVFCRVTPQQKSRVIAALKKRGHTVGFMGDGINDAAAMHEADVGISVDSGTDVAKAAADIILLDKDLSVIHAGVMEGRRAVENTRKYILMSGSSNFGNMFSMAGAALALPFLPMLPTQILLNNLLYDVSQSALPFDNVDPRTLSRPIRWNIRSIRNFMWIFGPISSVFDFVTFFVLLHMVHASESLFHTGWFVESLVSQTLIVFSIRTRAFILRSRPHPLLSCMMAGVASCAMILPFTAVGAWLGFTPPPAVFFAFLAATVAAYIVLVETVKYAFRRQIETTDSSVQTTNPAIRR